ncbi:MAG TPA: ABC transporter permease [Jatrophihabitantaceae bacterium]|jgi:peptide/nickel transport system permease protein|nr:ABC transporter permease [Jatrophihabitantaceae bacterium]
MAIADPLIAAEVAFDPAPVQQRPGRAMLRALLRSGTGMFGALVLAIIIIGAILEPWIRPHDPAAQDLSQRLKPPVLFGGHATHFFGTDQLGRDLLSRVMEGARASMVIAVSVVVIAGTFGVVMGLIAGYFGRIADTVIMRIADMQLAFPGILLALVILYALGPSAKLVIIVLAINGWMVYARVVRSMVLSLRKSEYIEAAEIGGSRPPRIMLRHVLPNIASPVLTLLVLEFARIILAEAALSFLGYGVQPPGSSWGLIIGQGQDYLQTAWWLVAVPGIFISITVLSANLLASWLRIYADPKLREKQLGRQLDALIKGRE